MNVVERTQEANRSNVLPPPLRLEVGSIVLLRMAGHTHSPGGLEYFAPAVVLAQYQDQYGSIDALVWDSSAGNHFAHGYHVRELGARGDGPKREMYELQSNVGQVLFSPDNFATMKEDMLMLLEQISIMQKQLNSLMNRTSAPVTTTTVTPEVEPKAQPKK